MQQAPLSLDRDRQIPALGGKADAGNEDLAIPFERYEIAGNEDLAIPFERYEIAGNGDLAIPFEQYEM